jgi:hypothetical protein
MSAQVAEMADQAGDLAATANQLRGLVAQFKLDGRALAEVPTPLRRAA